MKIWVHDWCPTWMADGKRCRAESDVRFTCEFCGHIAEPVHEEDARHERALMASRRRSAAQPAAPEDK